MQQRGTNTINMEYETDENTSLPSTQIRTRNNPKLTKLVRSHAMREETSPPRRPTSPLPPTITTASTSPITATTTDGNLATSHNNNNSHLSPSIDTSSMLISNLSPPVASSSPVLPTSTLQQHCNPVLVLSPSVSPKRLCDRPNCNNNNSGATHEVDNRGDGVVALPCEREGGGDGNTVLARGGCDSHVGEDGAGLEHCCHSHKVNKLNRQNLECCVTKRQTTQQTTTSQQTVVNIKSNGSCVCSNCQDISNNHLNNNHNNTLTVTRATNTRGGKLRQQSSSSLSYGSFDGGSCSSNTNSPCLSRDNSSEQYTDTTGVDLETFIPETLNRNAKDRALMLRIEQELVNLAKDKLKTHYKFPPMSSYQRMLVHRCAAYFGMDHNIESSGKCVVVNRTKSTRIPDVTFREHIVLLHHHQPNVINTLNNNSKDLDVGGNNITNTCCLEENSDLLQVSGSTPPRRSILKRDTSGDEYSGNGKSPDRGGHHGHQMAADRRSKSFEEREEEYAKVRRRIFHAIDQSGNEHSHHRSNHNNTNSTSTEDFRWSDVHWPSTDSEMSTSRHYNKLHIPTSHDHHRCYSNVRSNARLQKVQSEEKGDDTPRPCVAKSYSFGGYGGNGLTRGDSVVMPSNTTHNNTPRLLTKQDSGNSGTWRLSPSSSGYKSQSVVTTPSPTSTPSLHHCTSGEHTSSMSLSLRQDSSSTSYYEEPLEGASSSSTTTDTRLVWAVTDIHSVPRGSIIINPQTGQPVKNNDGSLYHYDPTNPPPGLEEPSNNTTNNTNNTLHCQNNPSSSHCENRNSLEASTNITTQTTNSDENITPLPSHSNNENNSDSIITTSNKIYSSDEIIEENINNSKEQFTSDNIGQNLNNDSETIDNSESFNTQNVQNINQSDNNEPSDTIDVKNKQTTCQLSQENYEISNENCQLSNCQANNANDHSSNSQPSTVGTVETNKATTETDATTMTVATPATTVRSRPPTRPSPHRRPPPLNCHPFTSSVHNFYNSTTSATSPSLPYTPPMTPVAPPGGGLLMTPRGYHPLGGGAASMPMFDHYNAPVYHHHHPQQHQQHHAAANYADVVYQPAAAGGMMAPASVTSGQQQCYVYTPYGVQSVSTPTGNTTPMCASVYQQLQQQQHQQQHGGQLIIAAGNNGQPQMESGLHEVPSYYMTADVNNPLALPLAPSGGAIGYQSLPWTPPQQQPSTAISYFHSNQPQQPPRAAYNIHHTQQGFLPSPYSAPTVPPANPDHLLPLFHHQPPPTHTVSLLYQPPPPAAHSAISPSPNTLAHQPYNNSPSNIGNPQHNIIFTQNIPYQQPHHPQQQPPPPPPPQTVLPMYAGYNGPSYSPYNNNSGHYANSSNSVNYPPNTPTPTGNTGTVFYHHPPAQVFGEQPPPPQQQQQQQQQHGNMAQMLHFSQLVQNMSLSNSGGGGGGGGKNYPLLERRHSTMSSRGSGSHGHHHVRVASGPKFGNGGGVCSSATTSGGNSPATTVMAGGGEMGGGAGAGAGGQQGGYMTGGHVFLRQMSNVQSSPPVLTSRTSRSPTPANITNPSASNTAIAELPMADNRHKITLPPPLYQGMPYMVQCGRTQPGTYRQPAMRPAMTSQAGGVDKMNRNNRKSRGNKQFLPPNGK